MTLLYLNVQQTLRFLKISNNLLCTWPAETDAGKLECALREILRGFSILIVISVMLPMMYATYHYRHDLLRMMKAASQSIIMVNVLSTLILGKLQKMEIQHLLVELKDSLRTFNDDEIIILQKHINRYTKVYSCIVIWLLIAIIGFSCGPIFLPMKFPAETHYPFPTESLVIICILYATQVYIIILATFTISIDLMLSMFFCYSSTKLEILWKEIQNVKDNMQIKYYVKKHQEIIEYVDKSKYVARYTLFIMNITMGLVVICSAIAVIKAPSTEASFQFIFIVLAAYVRLFITAWPADDLKENSEQLAFELYSTSWLDRPRSVIKDMHFMMQRSQKPLIISMGGMLPTLTLEYYLKYITTIFSYFTTMRVIFDD